MDAGTRYAVEQAIDDDLADKGFQRGEPADFVVAFSDVYIDRNRSDPGWPFEGPGVDSVEGVSGSQVEAYNDMEVFRTPQEASSAQASFAIDTLVVLPDHMHAVWTLPQGDDDFSTRWHLIKTFFVRDLPQTERLSCVRRADGERGIWQPGSGSTRLGTTRITRRTWTTSTSIR